MTEVLGTQWGPVSSVAFYKTTAWERRGLNGINSGGWDSQRYAGAGGGSCPQP